MVESLTIKEWEELFDRCVDNAFPTYTTSCCKIEVYLLLNPHTGHTICPECKQSCSVTRNEKTKT